MCPLGGALFDGFSKGPLAHLCCHCLLLETDQHGLVLVDTGFGEDDVRDPSRLSRLFRVLNNIRLDPARTAVAQLRKLGFQPADVRHILLTHLDFDHAGGLADFPNASIHLMQDEHAAAQQARGFLPRRRFVPAQWRGISRWQLYREEGDEWFGFQSVRSVVDDILLIPLRGHTAGHAGIAIRGEHGWVLHAGDAYFFRNEIAQASRQCPPGLRLYQRLMDTGGCLTSGACGPCPWSSRSWRSSAATMPGSWRVVCRQGPSGRPPPYYWVNVTQAVRHSTQSCSSTRSSSNFTGFAR